MQVEIANLDTKPDSALISVAATGEALDVSVSTIWRKIAEDPDFPRPIKLGTRCTRIRLGDLRTYIASKVQEVTE